MSGERNTTAAPSEMTVLGFSDKLPHEECDAFEKGSHSVPQALNFQPNETREGKVQVGLKKLVQGNLHP